MKFFLLLSIVFFSCNDNVLVKVEKVEPTENKLLFKDYNSRKQSISLLKSQYKKQWKTLPKEIKEKIFCSGIVDSIIPGWIGTPWDFNGVTENPPGGSIACGYFVTTVLRDGGMKLARIKLAQCASETMILELVHNHYIKRFSNVGIKEFINEIRKSGYGLYIIGLDMHTGFLFNDGIEIYFINASYVGKKVVTKELAVESSILSNSKYRVTAKISADENVLKDWIND